jgi:hypothetical protein
MSTIGHRIWRIRHRRSKVWHRIREMGHPNSGIWHRIFRIWESQEQDGAFHFEDSGSNLPDGNRKLGGRNGLLAGLERRPVLR